MRGNDPKQNGMFSYVSPEQRVPAEHPLRPLRTIDFSSRTPLRERKRRNSAGGEDWIRTRGCVSPEPRADR